MPNYIDKDKLIRDLIYNKSFYPAIVKSAIENAPVEDVVPRSKYEDWKGIAKAYRKQFEESYEKHQVELNKADQEIERLEHILNNYALQYGTVTDKQKVIDKAKQEAYKEVFEKISKRFEVLLKDYPCEGDWVSAKKFLGVHWKYIVNSIMADYKPNSKRNT